MVRPLVIPCLALLLGCAIPVQDESADPAPVNRGYARMGFALHAASLSDESDDSLSGSSWDVRVDAGISPISGLDVGARLAVGRIDAKDSNSMTTLESESAEMFFGPTARIRFDAPDSGFAPYAEAYVGVGFIDGDLTARSMGQTATVSDEGSGISYGGGFGVEFRAGRQGIISVGLDARGSHYSTDLLGDIDRGAFGVTLGYRF